MDDVDLAKITTLLEATVAPLGDSNDEVAAISGCCPLLDKLSPDALRRVFHYLAARYLDSMENQRVQLDKQAVIVRQLIASRSAQ